MLFGADFLSVNDVKMDFGTGTARIGHAEVVLHVKGCKKSVALSNTEQVTVPPNSEVVLRLACKRKCNKMFQFNVPIVLEPSRKLAESGILLAQTLTCMRKPYALLLNPTEHDIHIPPIRRAVIAHSAEEVLNNDDTSELYSHENIRLYSDSDNNVPKEALPEELRSLVPTEGFTLEMKACIMKLLNSYQDIFAVSGNPLGRTDVVTHTINTGDSPPIRVPKRRLPTKQQDLITAELQKMKDGPPYLVHVTSVL